MNPLLVRVLVAVGSVASVGFGAWHLAVPRAFGWYAYMDPKATELVAAVRATNAFFSLSLVLFGVAGMLLTWGGRSNRYSIAVVLAAASVLWLTRVAFQLIWPQGALVPGLRVGMLAAFVAVALCYAIPLLIVLTHREGL
jgi:hypothetical protein